MDQSMTQPLILRSREALHLEGSMLKNILKPFDLPIQQEGTRFTMAQEVTWLDEQHFAVGRWDGTLSVFRFNQSVTEGPLLSFAVNSPAEEGIQMIVSLNNGVFITSNDKSSFVVWQAATTNWKEVNSKVIPYSTEFGVANSGTAFPLDQLLIGVIGHESGFISIWDFTNPIAPKMIQSVDLRSSNPVNPWNLFNIRAVCFVERKGGIAWVLTGSEDGDLCLVEVPSGKIVFRRVYNPQAQRGINSVACVNGKEGYSILVANCSVGEQDKNLWHFTIKQQKLILTDAVNLRIEENDPQVFNFDVVFGIYKGNACFFSTTEEGALWMGEIRQEKIVLLGNKILGHPLGAAIATTHSGKLVMAAYDIYEFNTQPLSDSVDSTSSEVILNM